MLIMKPELRCSAQECYDRTPLLSRATETIAHTPTPASYAEDQQATPRPVMYNSRKDPQTAFQDPNWQEDDPIDSAEIQRYIRSDSPSPPTPGKRAMRVSGSALSEVRRTKRGRHSSLPAEPKSDGQGEFEAEMEHFYQDVNEDPLNSLYVGSSLTALERELPASWDHPSESSLPRSLSGSEPHLVEGGAGYVQNGCLINTVQGQADGGRTWGNGGRFWGVGGRSWGKGRSWENEGQTVEHAYDDEQEVAAALLLAMKDDDCRSEA
ncbi:hypothetical protein GQ53DRAFT_824940 [Thozetella sp. PMI_491]|nr:hypothetical protein GQ53DRAFT_824940 [Thozetella sp. PMI_491]